MVSHRKCQHLANNDVIRLRNKIGHAAGREEGPFSKNDASLRLVKVNPHKGEGHRQIHGDDQHPHQTCRPCYLDIRGRRDVFPQGKNLPIQIVKVLNMLLFILSQIDLHKRRLSPLNRKSCNRAIARGHPPDTFHRRFSA